MTGQDASHSNSGAAVSVAKFHELREQMNQLTQQLQTLQHNLRHAPNMDDHHDNDQHIEDDDPTVLQPEAARRAAAGGGGRGRGAGRGHGHVLAIVVQII